MTVKPLSIEELKALEVGEWVYVKDIDSIEGRYAILQRKFETNVELKSIDSLIVINELNCRNKWLVYKNKEYAEAQENSRIISDKEFWELSNRYTQKELDERIEFAKKKAVEEYKSKGGVVELPCLQDVKISCAGKIADAKRLCYLDSNGEIRTRLFEKYEFDEAERRLAELKGEKHD